MGDFRGEVSEFQVSTTLSSVAKPITALLASANNSTVRQIRITDLKISCGGAGRLVKVYGIGQETKALQLDMTADTIRNLSWQIPFKLQSVSSTAEVRGIVASASGDGIKFAMSGYIER